MSRPVLIRTLDCCMCGVTITFRSTTAPISEAPEMMMFDRAWVGMIAPHIGPGTVVACCSDTCVQALLEEGPAS